MARTSPRQENTGELQVILLSSDKDPIAKLTTMLKSFTPDDFLLLVGSPIYIGVAVHLVLLRYGFCHCLVWDRDHYRYNEEKVEVSSE